MLIERVQYIDIFLKEKLPQSEYLIVNSAWLSMMDIRINGDLDILVSNKLWNERFRDKSKEASFGLPGRYEKRLRVHSILSGPYAELPFVKSNDDLVYNHRVLIQGIPFISPKFYFLNKLNRLNNYKFRISNLPWWEKIGLFKGKNKKLFYKRNKDIKDLKYINKFFVNRQHLSEEWVMIDGIDWGFENNELKKILFS